MQAVAAIGVIDYGPFLYKSADLRNARRRLDTALAIRVSLPSKVILRSQDCQWLKCRSASICLPLCGVVSELEATARATDFSGAKVVATALHFFFFFVSTSREVQFHLFKVYRELASRHLPFSKSLILSMLRK